MTDLNKLPSGSSPNSLEQLSASSDELLRGLDDIGSAPKQELSTTDSLSINAFYSFNPTLLFWLSVITLGVYDILWFYRFWRHFKIRASALIDEDYPKNSRIIPFWCALFSGYYIVGTARRIRKELSSLPGNHALVNPWSAFWLYGIFGYINTNLAPLFTGSLSPAYLPATLFCSAIASFQVYRLQCLANEVNEAKFQSKQQRGANNLRFFDWIFIVFGCIYAISILSRL